MSESDMGGEVAFAPRILKPLVDALPCRVESLNLLEGAPGDAAQNEFVVQREIAAALKARLPCPTLVRQNEVLIRDQSGACLPDVIIDRIGSGIWAVFEVKLLLAGDRLCQSQVDRDLGKLCRYKAHYPDSHCIFLLIHSEGAQGVCGRSDRSTDASGDAADAVDFMIEKALHNEHLYKSRRGAVSKYHTATRAVAWEIVRAAEEDVVSTYCYRFVARMNDRGQGCVGNVF